MNTPPKTRPGETCYSRQPRSSRRVGARGFSTWTKDGDECYREGAVRSCATGAIRRAFGQKGLNCGGALDQLRSHLECIDALESGWIIAGQGIAEWNDHPDRTALEVAEVMRQAAKST